MIGKIIFNSEISKTLENIKSKEISSKFKELRNNELDIKKDKEKGSISTFQEADKPLFLEKEDYTSRELEKIKGLEKNDIINKTGFSNEIIDKINSFKELEIYKDAGLAEGTINDKKCLIRNDIDWEHKDSMGRSNKERALQGLSPINKDGNIIELHHIGQHSDSPLAELTTQEHRGKGNDAILHNKNKETEIDRQQFAIEKSNYWKERAEEGSIQ